MLLIFNNHQDLDGRHWIIGYQVGRLKDDVHTVWRQLQIVQERGFQHYTNWGPLTKTLDMASLVPPIAQVKICTMSRDQRAVLEQIASDAPVYVPNGSWNCQNWAIGVFDKAVDAGIVDPGDRDRCIAAGRTPGAVFVRHGAYHLSVASPILSQASDSIVKDTGIVGSYGFLSA